MAFLQLGADLGAAAGLPLFDHRVEVAHRAAAGQDIGDGVGQGAAERGALSGPAWPIDSRAWIGHADRNGDLFEVGRRSGVVGIPVQKATCGRWTMYFQGTELASVLLRGVGMIEPAASSA